MVRRTSILLAWALAAPAWCLLGAAPAAAQAPRADPNAQVAADVARLQQEVADLRQMLIQTMQVEQQHYDLLLKLIQSGGGRVALPSPTAPVPGGPGGAAPEARTTAVSAAVSGKVNATGVPAGQPIYVFLDNLRLPPARGRSLEIAQKDKQFAPQVAVVQRGTSVFFPNADRFTHNVFSSSKRSSFDLGTLKSGERGVPVVLNEPGVVEVFCDIHAKMWAEVLVAPNAHFVKVDGGSFRLPGIPVGERVLAVWTAGMAPVRRTVAVSADGSSVDFTLVVPPRTSHNNKTGQPYSSYGE